MIEFPNQVEQSEGNCNDDCVIHHGNWNIDVLLHSEQQTNDHAGYVEMAAPSDNDHRLEHGTEVGVLLNDEQRAGNQKAHVEEAAANGSNDRLNWPVLAVGDVPPLLRKSNKVRKSTFSSDFEYLAESDFNFRVWWSWDFQTKSSRVQTQANG